jgi:hypothetical protein
MLHSPPRYFKDVNEEPDFEIYNSILGAKMSHKRISDPIQNESYSIIESLREMSPEDEISEIESIEKSLEAIQIFLDKNPKIAKSIQVGLLYLFK